MDMQLIDGHAHLNEIEEIDRVIDKATQVGIRRIVAVGMDLLSNQETLRLAERFPKIIRPAIGYHPWSITPEGIEENLRFLSDHLALCVSLGEIGIDYRAKVKKKMQQEVFSRILHLALEFDRPVIVHSRFSHDMTYRMVRDAGIRRAVFHWYSGPLDVLEQIIDDGYFVSATPALAYSPPHQAAMKRAPIEQILIETDAPVVYQGKASEPADLLITLRELSRIKERSPEEIARITTANVEKLYDRNLEAGEFP